MIHYTFLLSTEQNKGTLVAMQFTIIDHWLSQAKHIASPNFNQRPDEQDISLLVIHNISLPPLLESACDEMGENKDYVSDFFCNQLDSFAHPYFEEIAGLEVSSHLYIRRDGEIIQYVPFNQRAWHAGLSHYQGRDNCNDFSIGIELEGSDYIPFTDQQYQQLVKVTECIKQHYPLVNNYRITGHEFIAPFRKTDPGPAFNWQRYFTSLNR